MSIKPDQLKWTQIEYIHVYADEPIVPQQESSRTQDSPRHTWYSGPKAWHPEENNVAWSDAEIPNPLWENIYLVFSSLRLFCHIGILSQASAQTQTRLLLACKWAEDILLVRCERAVCHCDSLVSAPPLVWQFLSLSFAFPNFSNCLNFSEPYQNGNLISLCKIYINLTFVLFLSLPIYLDTHTDCLVAVYFLLRTLTETPHLSTLRFPPVI